MDPAAMCNAIGKQMMAAEGLDLRGAGPGCATCWWLERGYQTSEEDGKEVWVVEILLHRRSYHIASPDHVN